MRRISVSALAVMLILSVCVGFAEAAFVNEMPSTSTETLYTIAGEAVSVSDEMLELNEQAGVGLRIPESWNEGDMLYTIRYLSNGIEIAAFPPSVTRALTELTQEEMDGMTDAQLSAYLMKSLPLMKLLTAKESPKTVGYDACERIAECGGKSVYAAYQTKDRGDDGYAWMTPEDHEAFMKAVGGLEELKRNVIVFPIEAAESAFQRFDAADLNGDPVTEAIFADYDLTLVNIWATWCGSCVGEMPELVKLCESLPENVNLITLCADAYASDALAREILADVGAKFVTIAGDPSMQATLLNGVRFYPTTLFLDREGRAVGAPIEYAQSMEAYAADVRERLDLLEG